MNEYKTGKDRNDADIPESLKTPDYIRKFPLVKAGTNTSDNQFNANETSRNPSNVVHVFNVLEHGNIDNMGIDT